jgi:crotonobetainyl-CoA:carnitine CoA-transferase CaiB-like acyl-CoA transferase
MRPLGDIRILAIEQYGAGPFATMGLADLGAEVIKVEDPAVGGDVGRYIPPYQAGEDSLFFETFNRNKRSITLDLGNSHGRGVFEDLVRRSDVVFSNLRGDVPTNLRIRYQDLKHLNARIVCCSLSGFGMTGPRAGEPAYDYLIQALSGWMSLTGEPDGPPTKSGLSLVDYSAGLVAANAILAGVHAAARDGVGIDCDVSLFDTAISMLSYIATWHLTAGFAPGRTSHSSHPSLVPFQAFDARDGWLVVACAKEKFFRRLVDALKQPRLARDPRFASFAARLEHSRELVAILAAVFRAETVDTWIERLRVAGVPSAPVNDVAAALSDTQTLARDLVVETSHPRFGTVRQVASPIRVGSEQPPLRRAPRRNEDGDDLLRGLLGYDDSELASLGKAGAFGSTNGDSASRQSQVSGSQL